MSLVGRPVPIHKVIEVSALSVVFILTYFCLPKPWCCWGWGCTGHSASTCRGPSWAAGHWANTAAPSDPQELPLQPAWGSLTSSNCIQSSHKDCTHVIFSPLQLNTLQQSYTLTFHRLWDSILNNICEVHRNVIISSIAHAEINNCLLRTGLALNVQQT